jgi:hypothetical protein
MRATRVFHDDWLVFVVMADGTVQVFNTELWPEHGDGSNWQPVEQRALRDAQQGFGRMVARALIGADCRVDPNCTREQFFAATRVYQETAL